MWTSGSFCSDDREAQKGTRRWQVLAARAAEMRWDALRWRWGCRALRHEGYGVQGLMSDKARGSEQKGKAGEAEGRTGKGACSAEGSTSGDRRGKGEEWRGWPQEWQRTCG